MTFSDGDVVAGQHEAKFRCGSSEPLVQCNATQVEIMPKLTTRTFAALTCSNAGLQMVWSTIFSHLAAYLSHLSLPGTTISYIWVLAPVCGVVAPPILGAISDTCQISWGRRRPFMLLGAVLITIAISALAWITPITHFLCTLHGASAMAMAVAPYWAVFWVVLLNIGIQMLQTSARALVLDTCPSEQQAVANAWVGRFTGLGSILGYGVGSVPVPIQLLGEALEAARFRWMAGCAVVVLLATLSCTLYLIEEQKPRIPTPKSPTFGSEMDEDGNTEISTALITRSFRAVRFSIVTMSPRLQNICRAQFFSAMAWFAFLFYNATYTSGLYLDATGFEGMVHGPKHIDVGMRFATKASISFAVLALGMNVVLPYIRLTSPSSNSDTVSSPKSFFRQTHILWALSLVLYATLMLATLLPTSPAAGTLTVTLAGGAWGVNQWAPYTLIGEELASQQSESLVVEQGGVRSDLHQTGALLGVNSMVVCVPQVIAALGSSLVMAWLKSLGLGDGVGWVLRFSGLTGCVAAWLVWRL